MNSMQVFVHEAPVVVNMISYCNAFYDVPKSCF